MREILDFALPKSCCKKLFAIDWNIYEQKLLKTIDKLQAVEPKIKAEAVKAKSNKEPNRQSLWYQRYQAQQQRYNKSDWRQENNVQNL